MSATPPLHNEGPRILKGSLRTKLTLAVAVLLAAVTLFIDFFYASRMSSQAQEWAEHRAVGIARVLASSVGPGLEFDDSKGVGDLLASLGAAPGAVYGVVRRDNGSILAAWRPEQVPADLSRSEGVLVRDGYMHVVATVQATAGTRGSLGVGFSLEELMRQRRTNLLVAGGVSVIFMLGGLALMSVLLGRVVVEPIGALTEITSHIVRTGDLSRDVVVNATDEVGLLAHSFREMVVRQRSIMFTLKNLVDGLAEVSDQIRRAGSTVASGATTIQSRVQETSESLVLMLDSLRGVAGNVEVLQRSAERGSVSIMQMATTNDGVAQSVQTMTAASQETTRAVAQMATFIKNIAKSIEELNATLAETSTSMTEIDAAIVQVERSATQTAKLSERVSADAEFGVDAIGRTLNGIDKIRDASRTATQVLDRLQSSVAEIGTILRVIDEVAEKTNLLALNASIIAAQAGAQGKGFGVVADEIKSLAERTRSSTTEISSLVRMIQEESHKAVLAVDEGIAKSVAEGVQLGREAGEALQKILGSANEATAMVQSIARATVEQAKGTKLITGAIHRLAETARDISQASSEQAKGAERIMGNTKRVDSLSQEVRHASEEQAAASKQVISAIENVNSMVRQVGNAQRQQTSSAEQVLQAVDAIKKVSEYQSASVKQLESAIALLKRQADDLQSQTQSFRV